MRAVRCPVCARTPVLPAQPKLPHVGKQVGHATDKLMKNILNAAKKAGKAVVKSIAKGPGAVKRAMKKTVKNAKRAAKKVAKASKKKLKQANKRIKRGRSVLRAPTAHALVYCFRLFFPVFRCGRA